MTFDLELRELVGVPGGVGAVVAEGPRLALEIKQRSPTTRWVTMETLYDTDSDSSPTDSKRDRLALVIAHGGTFFAWFLAPLIMYLAKRDSSRRVACEALQALLWSALGSVVALATCGLAIPVFLVWHLIGAVTAMQGRPFDYPLVAEIARRHVYGV
jgi:uncharacterized Tic20 family protein